MKFKLYVQNINYNISNNLKPGRSPYSQFKIDINQPFLKHLMDNYSISKRFSRCDDIIEDFNLIHKKDYNENTSIQIDEFYIKINNCKKVKVFNEGFQNEITYGPFLSIRILKKID